MKIKSNRKRRNVKKYKHSKTLKAFKKKNTIHYGGEIPPHPSSRRMSTGSLEQTSISSNSTRVSNLLNDKYKLCKENIGTKYAIYGEGKVRRAIVNNVNVLQSGNKIYLKNIEGNDYTVTLNSNDRDDIKEITTSNPLNHTQYPVILVDKNVPCQPVQQFGGLLETVVTENQPVVVTENQQLKYMPVTENQQLKDVPVVVTENQQLKDVVEDDELLLPDIEEEKSPSLLESESDDEPPPLPVEAQLQGCTKKNEVLKKYLDYYVVNERQHLIAENIKLQDELTHLKFSDVAPVEYQVRSAGGVPYIKAKDIYKQIDDVILDKDNADATSRLQLVATLFKKEPFFQPATKNFFYKFNVSPSPDEKPFDAIDSKGQKIQIPYPAVLFLRYQLGKGKGNKLILHGIYAVTRRTTLQKRIQPYEVDLKGIVKLETESSYEKREKEKKPVSVRGTLQSFDLKIDGHVTNMIFPDPDQTQIQRLADAIEAEKKSVSGNGTEYSLYRFHINDINEQKLYNFIKDVTSNGSPVNKINIGAKIGSVLTGASKSVAKSFVDGGKRKNMKYTINKIKNRKKRNTKKHKK
uniref:Uncharacterized protein n=1 Tax=viral metagenome TaxID=1070528 RepID=A0A6C0I1H6_9ZZZZ